MNKSYIINILKQELQQLQQFADGFEKMDRIDAIEIDIFFRKLENIKSELNLLAKYNAPSTQADQSAPDKEPVILKSARVSEIDERAVEMSVINEKAEEAEQPDPQEQSVGQHKEVINQPKGEIEASHEQNPPVNEVQTKSPQTDKAAHPQKEIIPEKSSKNDAVKVKQKSNKKETQVLGEKLGAKKRSVHDLIAQNNFEKDLGSQFKSSAVSDIRKAIPLNDRIWFQKELFANDAGLYEKTIGQLNTCTNLADAAAYLQSEFDWDAESRVVQKFLKTISRKYL